MSEYSGKVFRSGNSLALRLPKALGIEEGARLRIVQEEAGGFRAEPVDQPKRKFNIAKVWGCARGSALRPIRPNDRVFEHRPLLWDDPQWRAGRDDGE